MANKHTKRWPTPHIMRANQKNNEVSSHTHYSGYYPNKLENNKLAKTWRNCNPCVLLMGVLNVTATKENILLKKLKIQILYQRVWAHPCSLRVIHHSHEVETTQISSNG